MTFICSTIWASPGPVFFDDYDIWNFLEERKKEGLIRHLGFSFHDKADALEEILTAHPEMEFVQLQINYADWEAPEIESRKCYETARRHGKPVIIMEPVKGGNLANLPEKAADVLKKADPDASQASWAIRFAASLDGIVTVLSGMSNVEQMADNLAFMKDFKPLDEDEQETIRAVRAALDEYPTVPCTACAYCMKGCPKSIAIYGAFQPLICIHCMAIWRRPRGNIPGTPTATAGLKLPHVSAAANVSKSVPSIYIYGMNLRRRRLCWKIKPDRKVDGLR